MLRIISGTLLALLLAVSAVAGPCASCPLLAPENASGCCQHHQRSGDCPAPVHQHAGAQCPNLALVPAAHHPTQLDVTHLVVLPAILPAVAQPILAAFFAPAPRRTIVHSPPDLYLLNATLLI